LSEAAPRATPRTIYAALLLLPFAAAAPFIGSAIEDHVSRDDPPILGIFFEWLLIGLFAAFAGIACTIVGAWRAPRSWLTWLAILFAVLLFIAVIGLFSLLIGKH
jgi:hypothetical protein